MKEIFESRPLKELIRKPQFANLGDIRTYVFNLLDLSKKRDKLDQHSISKMNEGRKKTFILNWTQDSSLVQELIIKESKDKKEIVIGVAEYCRDTKKAEFTEQFLISGKEPNEDFYGDSLQIYHIDGRNDNENNHPLDPEGVKEAIQKINNLLGRVVESNFI